ncbi:MAG TPA: tetratricopeptide repeat protein [Thermoanaerobaculia bacterium]|nr:tetratricopeptide repeat protein [Thermoanaerobaculia bacterium]
MKRLETRAVSSFLLLAIVALMGGCSSGRNDLSLASSQMNFGVRSARMNLWREALFRFRRASQIEPTSALAANNLAVAYEGTGDFDKARESYVEALRLDRTNVHIQKNYSRFTEFAARNKKRDAKANVTAPKPLDDSKPDSPAASVVPPALGPAEPPLQLPEAGPPQKPVSVPPSSGKPGVNR